VHVLQGHTSWVMSVAFAPDGSTLASGSWDKMVRLWDAKTGAQVRVMRGHTEGVRSVAFAPDGSTLASGSLDKTVRLWNTMTGALVRVLQGHTDSVISVAFALDGSTLASGSYDNTVRLWLQPPAPWTPSSHDLSHPSFQQTANVLYALFGSLRHHVPLLSRGVWENVMQAVLARVW